jgi:transcriptional regulator with GAF, ATPase, and Fis domain
MSHNRIRRAMMHFEFEIDQDTKDQIEDLLREYTDVNQLVAKAIEVLHAKHFGVPTTSKLPGESKSLAQKPLNEASSKKIDQLLKFMRNLSEKQQQLQQNNSRELSPEASQQILEKIEELGVKFTKVVPPELKINGTKTTTSEMSQEEVLQLIKRIDQLETKLTRVISQSSSISGPPRRQRPQQMESGDVPKISKIEGEGKQEPTSRPLLDDVLNTVIVSVETEEDKE